MRLVKFKYYNHESSHPLNGFNYSFRASNSKKSTINPICLAGINGSGKSKLLESLAIVFDFIHGSYSSFLIKPKNRKLEFELIYTHRKNQKYNFVEFVFSIETKRLKCRIGSTLSNLKELNDKEVKNYLPDVVLGYSSGENESLSRWFRSYLDVYKIESQTIALKEKETGGLLYRKKGNSKLPTLSQLLWIDFEMNKLVFIANSIFSKGNESFWKNVTDGSRIDGLRSFRLILKFKPRGGPSKGIFATEEQKKIVERLKKCASGKQRILKEDTWVLDFYHGSTNWKLFKKYFKNSFDLYLSLFKLDTLNFVMNKSESDEIKRIEKETGESFVRTSLLESRRAFSLSQIKVRLKDTSTIVHYHDLSDGEHQFLQVFGTLRMIEHENALFLMDEPETHFNPQWRSAFISKLSQLKKGRSSQEFIITTHSPFLLSDSQREDVFIFEREKNEISVRKPKIQTYGASTDIILQEAFGVAPPVAQLSREKLLKLLRSKTAKLDDYKNALKQFGSSPEKLLLFHRIQELEEKQKKKNKI